jgi:nitrate/TMAO reductase-like tetraheme cytochrome c subunit
MADHEDTATSAKTGWLSSLPKRRRLLVIAGAAALVLAVVGLAAAVYTERPQFCPTCHEMSPYYDAWTKAKHAKISCIDCHVDPGVVNHGLHKFVALKELWDHFTKDNRFPTWGVELPDSRCLRCHATIAPKLPKAFSHALHAGKAQCKNCHPTVGHLVTLQALRDAGILASGGVEPPAPGGMTPSAAAGHKAVPCQRCHDQAKMKCALCHQPPHEPKGDCSWCHKPGEKFLFVHPAGDECSKCHNAPAKHAGPPCARCHKNAHISWAFTHPPDPACASCHAPPANHFGSSCSNCHSPSVPFAKAVFRHRGNTGEHSYRSFPCAKCHPKGYGSASCTCHGGRPPRGD